MLGSPLRYVECRVWISSIEDIDVAECRECVSRGWLHAECRECVSRGWLHAECRVCIERGENAKGAQAGVGYEYCADYWCRI
jgi:hypothetical protein